MDAQPLDGTEVELRDELLDSGVEEFCRHASPTMRVQRLRGAMKCRANERRAGLLQQSL
jgi:hypothetical protein